MEPTQAQPREEAPAPVEQHHTPQPHDQPKPERAPREHKPKQRHTPKPQRPQNEAKKSDAHQLPAFLMRPINLPKIAPKPAKKKEDAQG
jgi:hypothetical protein